MEACKGQQYDMDFSRCISDRGSNPDMIRLKTPFDRMLFKMGAILA